MKKSVLNMIAIVSLGLFSQIANAKVFSDNAQCYVQVHDQSLAPNNPPDKTFGSATSKVSQAEACKEAKRVATQKAPRGTYARHCFCESEKNSRPKKPTKKK